MSASSETEIERQLAELVRVNSELVSTVADLGRELSAMKQGRIESRSSGVISLGDAAYRAGLSIECMRRWAVRERLGSKVGGRWQIDPAKLIAFIGGARRPRP